MNTEPVNVSDLHQDPSNVRKGESRLLVDGEVLEASNGCDGLNPEGLRPYLDGVFLKDSYRVERVGDIVRISSFLVNNGAYYVERVGSEERVARCENGYAFSRVTIKRGDGVETSPSEA